MITLILILAVWAYLILLGHDATESYEYRKAHLLAYAKGDIQLMNRAIKYAQCQHRIPSEEQIMAAMDKIRKSAE